MLDMLFLMFVAGCYAKIDHVHPQVSPQITHLLRTDHTSHLEEVVSAFFLGMNMLTGTDLYCKNIENLVLITLDIPFVQDIPSLCEGSGTFSPDGLRGDMFVKFSVGLISWIALWHTRDEKKL
ncbi:hypothetical protein BDQ12DRAFT_403704 [Crucibulum laeve]|uniref:Uncharacterized protein n=1 Tax=Crucibulum laeve TaxID=68775 RepID=A0A5C3LN38_9AGAR|nr:hypothetical protein BDQ12DRAFT_403704 [Crucibulum laeve]